MSKPQTQRGYVYSSGGAWHVRYYAHENSVRKQRSHRLCTIDEQHSLKDSPSVMKLAEDFMLRTNAANAFNDGQAGHNCPICGSRCKRTIEQKFAPKV